jgi:hypothetical protein
MADKTAGNPSTSEPNEPPSAEKTGVIPWTHPDYEALMVDRPPPQGIHYTTWAYAACLTDVHTHIQVSREVNVSRACKATGWPRHTYYHALKDPEAAELSKAQMLGVQSAAALMIQARWVDVVDNMLEIASTQEGVAAVRAAAFVRDLTNDFDAIVEEVIAAKDQSRGEKSPAALMLEQFPPRSKVTRTVTETVQVEPEDAIDVTPQD